MHSCLLSRFVAYLIPPAARYRPRRGLVANPCRNISSICWIVRRDIDNRRHLAELAAGPSVDKAQPVDFVELICSERERRESQLARGRSSVE